jgi:hypothetical protein
MHELNKGQEFYLLHDLQSTNVLRNMKSNMCIGHHQSYLTVETLSLGAARSIFWATSCHGIQSRVSAHMKSECFLFKILITPILFSNWQH